MQASIWGKVVGLGLVAAAGALAMPATAQMYSEGFKFLEAVEKKEAQNVIDMLARPGSTLINARNLSNNRTALHMVVERRDQTWVNFLLQRGADPNLADKNGITPLILAVRLGFLPGVEALVSKGARVDQPNDAGETPLITAVHNRNIPLMRALLKAGADPDRTDNSGRSAREYAALEGANSTTLAEIVASAKNSASAAASTYGPTIRR